MNGGIEAAGDLGTAMAWARTAEPGAGESTAHPSTATCLNCGAALVGHYCHGCGQSAHVHRTLISIVHDLLHGVFHFEGKIWRTVPMLVLHPGQLTRRYIAGERARYVSPLAMFLFTVFLMFATYGAVGPGDLTKGFADGLTKSDINIAAAVQDSQAKIARLERSRADQVTKGGNTVALDRQLKDERDYLTTLAGIRQRIGQSPTGATPRVYSRWHWLNEALERARENPGLVIYKVQSAAYKYSWVLIFLSTPFVALLFLWRRGFGLYDHATFVTYSITFMSLLAIVLEVMLTVGAPDALFMTLLLLVPPVHMFVQLRGAYGLRIFSALWRTVFLLMAAWFAIALFVMGVITLELAH